MPSDQILKKMAPLRVTKRRFHYLCGGLTLWGVSVLTLLFAIALAVIFLIKLLTSDDSSSVDSTNKYLPTVDFRFVNLHSYDNSLSNGLLKFWKSENANSIIDLGAGSGLYARDTMAADILTSCYDKNPKTFEISEGRCTMVDLTKPIYFAKHDWVISLETAEHIAKDFEDIFIGNLDKVNKKGIVISWAGENGEGLGHVNRRSNKYIIEKIEKLGYKADIEAQVVLRTAAKKPFFKNTIMVFRSTKNNNNNTGLFGFLFG